jgi:hypothetical protein
VDEAGPFGPYRAPSGRAKIQAVVDTYTLTVQQALEEARHRWGPDAALCNRDPGDGHCLVGVFRDGRFHVKGIGASWPEAFEDAETHFRTPLELSAKAVTIVVPKRRERLRSP